ncbi:hypothetical protein [Demequina litorisediminis]|uniref:Tail assembly chaperone n=1 Tax=Demequina litorisediminis TaxID=1849022 RepID=A0ABQ6IC35_9MICO|nr:hypothetical protein [Demequina litorisediminis]GMA34742.1 hypothetical protein GCM10025876_09460 [Demequina litorisediminis]
MFDIENLTLGEIATIEDLAGASISTLGEDETPKGKMLAAMAMIAKRRNGFPDFKWNDAITLTMTEATEVLGLGDTETEDEPDPTEPVSA